MAVRSQAWLLPRDKCVECGPHASVPSPLFSYTLFSFMHRTRLTSTRAPAGRLRVARHFSGGCQRPHSLQVPAGRLNLTS